MLHGFHVVHSYMSSGGGGFDIDINLLYYYIILI